MAQIESKKRNFQKEIQVLEEKQTEISNFVNDSDLQGLTWDSAKSRYCYHLCEQMLQKIYNYCNLTNNLHDNNLAQLNCSVTAGINALGDSAGAHGTSKWSSLDTSWVSGLYDNMAKVSDDYNLQESRNNPNTIKFSSDMQYIFCNGQKWPIDGGEVKFSEIGIDRPGFYSNWSDLFDVEEDYSAFDPVLYFAYNLRYFGSDSKDCKPEWDSRLSTNKDIVGIFSGAKLASSVLDNLVDSKELATYEGKIKFVFQTRGNEKRVQILVSGELTSFDRAKNFFTASESTDQSIADYQTVENSIDHGINAKPGLHSSKNDFFKDATGKTPDGDVHFGASLQERVGKYTSKIHFDENGNAVETLIPFMNDKVTAWDTAHPDEVFDVTQAWHNLERKPSDKLIKNF